ncbi:MAG: hypothetical protein ABI390_05915 [Daejeonella sp.]
MKILKLSALLFCSTLLITCKDGPVAQKDMALDNSSLQQSAKSQLLMSLDGAVKPVSKSNGKYVAVYSAEYLTSGEGDEMGRTVYFDNKGSKKLGGDFAPGTSLDGTDNVSYYVDKNRPSLDLSVSTSEAAIDRAMQTWDGVTCSNLGMTKIPFNAAIKTGFVAKALGYPGSYDYVADVNHAGWEPGAFFDAIAPAGSTYILGVTFTIIFTDANGNPVDTNNDNKYDVAFREIYYNDAFLWKDGSTYDVETVALHESGHGLSQAHFGTAFRTGNGKLHFSPRAIMNAAYSGVQTEINKTDNAGHCSIWANWPNK